MGKSFLARNWPKYLLQWLSLGAIVVFLTGLAGMVFPEMDKPDPEALCPMGGLQAFGTYLVRGSLPCTMNTLQIVMGLALAAAVVFLGKLFCGYLCPVGTVEDGLGRLRRALHIRAFNISRRSAADKVLRIVKYGLLFWIFYMTCTSSELFCKKFDPYYAVATGFKGEIVLWGSISTVVLVLLPGLFIDRFWCKYICPLGAVSNSLKFYLPLGGILLLWWALSLLGVHLHWAWLLGALCLTGYLFEVFHRRPAGQLLTLVRDETACTRCGLCEKECPYAIDILHYGAKMNDVDCTLCGDCTGVCAHKALGVGGVMRAGKPASWKKMLPPCLAVVLTVAAFCIGNTYELPTIDEEWGMEQVAGHLDKVEVEGLRTVKCFGSSMAFKARMEKVPGVHRVRTYVKSHRVEVFYDSKVTDADKIRTAIFVPSRFRIKTPDHRLVPELKVMTIRVEKMFDKLDLNYLGLQMRQSGRGVYGLESEFDCPVKVRVYVDPAEEWDAAWFKEMVNRKSLDMPLHGGGVKKTPMNLEFVRLEKEEDGIAATAFLERMFDGFHAAYNGRYARTSLPPALREGRQEDSIVVKRSEVYAGKKQYIYELADTNYQKPIVRRALPFLSNHISREEGIISLSLTLNKDYVPALQIRFAAPATSERIWELLQAEMWTITYKKDDVRQEKPRLAFRKEGEVFPAEAASPQRQ